MGASAYEKAAIVRVVDAGLVQHVVTPALVEPVDDRGERPDLFPRADRREELPVLLGMKIPEQFLQIPVSEPLVAFGVIEQRWRPARLGQARVVERIRLEADDFRGHVVSARAAEATHIRRLTVETDGECTSYPADSVHLSCNRWNAGLGGR